MYWIEIEFVNGKLIKKQYESLNDSFAVFKKYCCGSPHRKRPVRFVRAGYGDKQTFECDHLENVCT